jgi:ATP-dependent Zn protease/uncharacterized protein (UPF0248 family)
MQKNNNHLNLLYFSNNMVMKTYLINLKLQIRNFFISNSKSLINIKVVLGCFPIVFGISKTLYFKHQNDIFSNVLKNSLPGISPLSFQISWPTLEQIFLDQLQVDYNQFGAPNLNKSYIKRVDFYTDSLFIQTNSNWYTKQKQVNMAAFNRLDLFEISNKKKIGNNWYTIFSKTQKKSSFTDKTKKKNWNLYPTYNTSNTLTFRFNPKLTAVAKKNSYILNLDELPLKLNSSSVFNQTLATDVLENALCLTKVNFIEKKQKIDFEKSGTNHILLFSADKLSILPTNIISTNKIKHGSKKTLFISQKILNKKITNCLLNPRKKSKFSASVTILNGIQNRIPFALQSKGQNEIYKNKKNLGFNNFTNTPSLHLDSNFLEIILNKKKFLENKLKENLFNKTLFPFSNFHELDFSSNLLKQKNIKFEINLLLQAIDEKTCIFSSAELLYLLELIEQIGIFHENYVMEPTSMSGYILPDSSNEQNLSLVVKFLYKKNTRLLHTIFSDSLKKLWNPVLQITIPKNFSYSLNSNLSSQIFNFYLQSKKTHYVVPYSQGKNIYQGPSISQNKITNELNTTNFTQLKQSVRQFFSSDSIISDRREIFFGKNAYAIQKHKYDSSNSNYFSKFESKLNQMKSMKTGLLRKGRKIILFEMPLKSNTFLSRQKNNSETEKRLLYKEILQPKSIISYDEYPYIIYLDEKEWKIFSEKLSKEKNELIPIFNVKIPKKKWNIWCLNQFNSENVNNSIFSHFPLLCNAKGKNTTNRVSNIRFNTISNSYLNLHNKNTQTGKENYISKTEKENYISNFFYKPTIDFSNIPVSYHYFPYCESLLKEILPKKYFFGKTYKKNLSIYNTEIKHKNKFNPLFYENVEPISSDSWLFFAQFSIGLFLLHFLQNMFVKYGKELKDGISNLLEGKTENSNGIDNNINEDTIGSEVDEKFRLIQNIEKNFHNIAGVDALLPELSEIVWFLRNSGKSFKIGNTIPRRILLTGLPGTGKTLLVQAIAGEAGVPVLIESGSSFNQAGNSENGPERLKNIFRKAREIAPCIIFIDEIDSFGGKRNQMLENSSVNAEIFDSISLYDTKLFENTFQVQNFDFLPQSKFSAGTQLIESNQQSDFQTDSGVNSENFLVNKGNKNGNKKSFNKHNYTHKKANILMQFLIELDGIATEKKILVFGATNRPEILDSALTRPGRFNKVFHLNLPNKQKRIEILKLYSKNLGVDTHISWNYLANLTSGLSAADLASAMNQSSMKAIQTETIHTVETIEYGIECITGYSTQKNQLKSFIQLKKNKLTRNSQSIFISRLAYYQAGKAVVHTLLEKHPQVVSVSLWPEVRNTRYHLINGVIEKEFLQIKTRVELESRIIGFYAGKAAELVALFNYPSKISNHPFLSITKSTSLNYNSTYYSLKPSSSVKKLKSHIKNTNSDKMNKTKFLYSWHSDLGVQDMSFAGWLAQLMITNWYLYTKQISIEKFNQFQNNSNIENILDSEILEVFKQLSYEIQNENNRNTILSSGNSQNWITNFWLQKQIVRKLEYSYSNNSNWYKIYEGDHEENENTRCLPPDEYYHGNTYLKNMLNNKLKPIQTKFPNSSTKQYLEKTFFKSSLTLMDAFAANRSGLYHSLILTCFNKSMSILDQNREVLDFFASYLIQKEIIRENEVTTIFNNFKKNGKNIKKQQNSISKFSLNEVIVEQNWKNSSGKKYCRFINFENL